MKTPAMEPLRIHLSFMEKGMIEKSVHKRPRTLAKIDTLRFLLCSKTI
jgi:hypothetical protein